MTGWYDDDDGYPDDADACMLIYVRTNEQVLGRLMPMVMTKLGYGYVSKFFFCSNLTWLFLRAANAMQEVGVL
jgi:hypothetical protein